MTLFEEHMKYADDVLRIREAMHLGFFENLKGITSTYASQFKIKITKFNYKGGGAFPIGDINTHTWTMEDTFNNATIITKKSIVFTNNDSAALSTYGVSDTKFEIETYNEELHFQHSLLYSDEELRGRVVAGALKNQKIDYGNRFKIMWYYVPMLAKLVRYKDNGIL